uniref:Phosphoglycerate mutase-like protein n=1 Tax=Lotharella globosa TaxID=91324 RepID=A0A6V3K2X2_9EUKA
MGAKMGRCCGTTTLHNHEEQEKETHLRFLQAASAAKQEDWIIRMKASRYVPTETLARGTKLIYFVRHGQGYHNLAAAESKFRCDCREENTGNCPYLDAELTDPKLTPLGVKQANKLARITKELKLQPEIVYLSPLCRAIQTGLVGFTHLIEEKSVSVPFVAAPGAREQSGLHMCDKRRNLKDIKEEFPQVDFEHIKGVDDLRSQTE